MEDMHIPEVQTKVIQLASLEKLTAKLKLAKRKDL